MDAVLVDTSHLMYRSFHTFNKFSTSQGAITGIHYGIMRAIEHLKKVCPNSYIVFVLDGKCHQRRSIYPEYKAGREKTESHGEIVHEFGIKHDIIELVKATGCAVAQHQDYECDDLIAMMTHRGHDGYGKYIPMNPGEKTGSKTIIYSGDDDFCQLVTSLTLVLKPPASKTVPERWMDLIQVRKEWNVDPWSLALYRSFTGDSGDNIKGIPRCPRAELQQAVQGKRTPNEFYEGDSLAYFNPTWKSRLTAFRPNLEINYRLTSLPWDYLPKLQIEYLECGLNISNLASIFDRLEFTSFKNKLGAFEELLGPTSYVKALSDLSNRLESGSNTA